tara:strand:+ start:4441 stop:5190 length:750 start_codon:yes stop_codon:yes gene_type:complete
MMITILFFGVILTGLIAEFSSKKLERFKDPIISFSVSIVLTLICVHILPEIFSSPNIGIGYYLLAGFLIQILLELLSKGIEHGHVHLYGKINGNQLFMIFIGLSIHSFIEGFPINTIENVQHGHHFHPDSSMGYHFSWLYLFMILIHKLPIAAVLIFFLNSIGVSKIKKYGLLIIFASTTPIGALLGEKLIQISFFNDWSLKFLAISCGMLLHITTLLIFEDHHQSKNKSKNIITISLGIAVGILLFSF